MRRKQVSARGVRQMSEFSLGQFGLASTGETAHSRVKPRDDAGAAIGMSLKGSFEETERERN